MWIKIPNGDFIHLSAVHCIGLRTHAMDRRVEEGTAKLIVDRGAIGSPAPAVCVLEGPESYMEKVFEGIGKWLARCEAGVYDVPAQHGRPPQPSALILANGST